MVAIIMLGYGLLFMVYWLCDMALGLGYGFWDLGFGLWGIKCTMALVVVETRRMLFCQPPDPAHCKLTLLMAITLTLS